MGVPQGVHTQGVPEGVYHRVYIPRVYIGWYIQGVPTQGVPRVVYTRVCLPTIPRWCIYPGMPPYYTTLGTQCYTPSCTLLGTLQHCWHRAGGGSPGLRREESPGWKASKPLRTLKSVKVGREAMRRVTPLLLHINVERLDRRRVFKPVYP